LSAAHYFTGRSTEAVATSKEFLSRSPSHLYGHLGLALSYLMQWAFQENPDAQTLAQAEAAVQRALTLNADDPISRGFLGLVYLWQKHYEQAVAEMERAIALNPNLADSYAFLADTLSCVGRSEEAIAMAEQALRHKPFFADGLLREAARGIFPSSAGSARGRPAWQALPACGRSCSGRAARPSVPRRSLGTSRPQEQKP
jgi:tetratricopeptide (TPR) repeat protein